MTDHGFGTQEWQAERGGTVSQDAQLKTGRPRRGRPGVAVAVRLAGDVLLRALLAPEVVDYFTVRFDVRSEDEHLEPIGSGLEASRDARTDPHRVERG